MPDVRRIASPVCTYPPYAGGIGNVAERQAQILTRNGVQVSILTPAHDPPPGTTTQDGVVVHRLAPLIRHGNSALVRGIAHHVRASDLVYIHYPFYGGAEPAAFACRRHGIPYVVFFHMDVHRTGIAGGILGAHRKTIQPWILHGAKAVLVSSLDYSSLSSIGHLQLRNLVESPYAAPARFSPAGPDEAGVRRLGLDPDLPTFLFVGAMDSDHAFKGVPELLRAFDEIHSTSPSAQLALAGDGGMRPSYERLAASRGTHNVHFVGRVSDDDLVNLYRFAYATVLPSTTSDEAYGVVLAEGMACGCPSIASALPGVRALVTENVTGLLTPPGDVPALVRAMRTLLESPDMRRHMSDAALEERTVSRSPEHEEALFLRTLGLSR